MDFIGFLEKSMMMDDATWKRHANPWSVWTRVIILPLLTLAIWSRVWIGWWCIIPIILLIIWAFVNPRAFTKPASTTSWASMATFGERVWLNRKQHPVPKHHQRFIPVLSAMTGLATLPLIYALITNDGIIACFSVILVVGIKLWFLDRMVWLYQDMKDQNPEYASWQYSDKAAV